MNFASGRGALEMGLSDYPDIQHEFKIRNGASDLDFAPNLRDRPNAGREKGRKAHILAPA
jgi:hypothetical protein